MKKGIADRPAAVGMGASAGQHANQSPTLSGDHENIARPRLARPIRACLIGTGAIAHTHAEALRALPNVKISAVVDANPARARAFAAKWTIPHVFRDISDALTVGNFDAAHVLTPPDTHYELARACIESSVHTLVEKPLAVSADEAETLVGLAAERNLVCAVNQNFVFHPAFAALCARLQANEVGPLRSLMVSYNAPLRQLAARQFGAWMFARPLNILLEQAVHPLSQIVTLIGPVTGIQASAGESLMLGKDAPFYPTCDAILRSDSGVVAHLQFAVGRAFPHWEVRAQCDDGVLVADMIQNRCTAIARGRYVEPVDALLQSFAQGWALACAGSRNAFDFVAALLRLKPRNDAFFTSMRSSLGAYYAALEGATFPAVEPPALAFGATLVETCEEMAHQAYAKERPMRALPAAINPAEPADVLVIGATGFLGKATVERFVAAGWRVRAVARNIANLPEIFHHPQVSIDRADLADPATLQSMIADVPVVVNLAHGGGGDSWAAIRNAMVGGARNVADACLAAGTRRLIHVGSIAGLYAGNPRAVITGATAHDPNGHLRADYARAKAEADQMLLRMHDELGLPVCILRPGIAIGPGTNLFHSGVGIFNNEQHCIGWSRGRHGLPLVLGEDFADAVLCAASREGIDGQCYNLVGDVRLTAQEYIGALGAATRRPLRFHPSWPAVVHAQDFGKWLLKRIGGRKSPRPTYYDLRSRGLYAAFDCTDAKRDLGWAPESDRQRFLRRAFGVG